LIRRVFALGAVLAGAFAVTLACDSLVGVGELSCGSPDSGSPSIDTCTGDSGVIVLSTSGEIRGLAWVDTTLVAVGYVQGATTQLAVQAFSATGASLGDPQLDDASSPDSAATSVIAEGDGVVVSGGNGSSFVFREYAVNPLRSLLPANFAQTSATYNTTNNDNVPLREAVSVGGNTLFGTTIDSRLAIVRYNAETVTSPPTPTKHDAVYEASVPLRATDGIVVVHDPDASDDSGANGTVTILGCGSDGGPGLVMVRWPSKYPDMFGPDPTFNDGGSLIAPFGNGGSARTIINVPDDFSYWVGGQDNDASGFVVARVQWNGSIDGTWTAPGSTRGINAILAIDGGVLAAGFADGNLALARFTLDAGIDETFGDAGVLEIPLPGELKAIAQTDNRYVAGGFTTKNGTKQWVLVWLIP
jgi:hypothetical protein